MIADTASILSRHLSSERNLLMHSSVQVLNLLPIRDHLFSCSRAH
jgi:hypothetical protein